MAERLGSTPEALCGRSLWERLVEPDARRLQDTLDSGARDIQPVLLNFVGIDGAPFTLRTSIDVQPDRLVLVGEPMVKQEEQLATQLLQLNNELVVLAREHARQGQVVARAHVELESVHKELTDSHWHLRKIQEVLPICMKCHKVKTGDGQWDELVQFFQEHSQFLSHGYCPECASNLIAEIHDAADRPVSTELGQYWSRGLKD
jgi:hypothetical protein